MSYGTQLPFNGLAAHQDLLRERLKLLLGTLHPGLRADVERALSEKGKLLSPSPNGSEPLSPDLPAGNWPLLTLLVAQFVSPNIDLVKASSVALAVECFVCALDLLDDVEDEDQTPVVKELGVARVLNVSTTLLGLAQQALLSLTQQKASPALILRLLRAFRECLIDATIGQHRDLLAEQRPLRELTREECIEIAAGKAGAIMRLACLAGAICTGAKKSLREQFAGLGVLLGIAHQLDNDAHDLYYLLQEITSTGAATQSSSSSRKSDMARGKKTLPVVLAASSLAERRERGEALPGHDSLDAALRNLAGLADDERGEYRRVLDEGIVATWGIALLYRERAHERLQEIEAGRPVAAELRLLLGFEFSP